ncbi:hypothetical protein [Streptosporangium subroseum]|uniref:hypothetical protein n=1 Tax=Streptosporangium subroseum TaxID=106412 RepID=UPI00308DD3A0|nr:hypothetical protein OHB15_49475 [Streptosporangium subroseum]
MSVETDPLGIQWVVACLSPADISPHPNFRIDYVSEPELLALVIQFQWQEYADYRDLFEETDEVQDGTRMLVNAALKSLMTDTVSAGIQGLYKAAKDDNLTLGARVAAALIVATVSADIDQPEKYTRLLDELATTVARSSIGSAGSRALAVAGLLQQGALRSFEAGTIDLSREFANRVIDTLNGSDSSWDEFSVSRGIGWDASESQRRLTRFIIGNARSLLAHTADLSDNSWVDIVRSPFPTAAVRQTRDMLSALTAVTEETFKRNYKSSTRTRVLGKGDAVLTLAYSSLLNAELTGDVASTARSRKTLGDIFAIRLANGASDPEWYGEAIRLFRQGEADDNLKRFLQDVREQGPLDSLSRSAESLIDTRMPQSYVTSCDLLLLEKAADLISPEHAAKAIRLALDYATLKRGGRLKDINNASWKRTEIALSTIASLIFVDSDVNLPSALDGVIEIISMPGAVREQFAFSALAKLASRINWDNVSNETRNEWLNRVESAASSTRVLSTDYLRIYAEMNEAPPQALVESLSGFEFVVALLNGIIGHAPTAEDLDRTTHIVATALVEDRRDAAKGTYHGYLWSPFSMAAQLITSHARDDLWPPLLDALLDANVSKEYKIDALDTLAKRSSMSMMPTYIREALQVSRIPVESGPRDPFFPTSIDRLNIACRNFYIAYDLLDDGEVQEGILRDSRSSESRIRAEAAKGCLFVVTRKPDVEWPQVVVTQLSFDHDMFVRHRAAYVLAYLSMVGDIKFRTVVKSRVRELLGEPGISPSMGILHGLRAFVDDATSDSTLWCEDEVRELLHSHPSRNIRAAARKVLDLYRR